MAEKKKANPTEAPVAVTTPRSVAKQSVAQRLLELGIDPEDKTPVEVHQIDWSPTRAYQFVGEDYDPENFDYMRADLDDGGRQVRALEREGWKTNIDIDVRMRGAFRPDEIILVRRKDVSAEFERKNAELVASRRRARSQEHEVAVGGKVLTGSYRESAARVRTEAGKETDAPPTRR